MATRSGAVEFGKRIASDFSEKNVSFMAAALAYHAFLSLAPLLLLLVLVFTTVGVGVEARLVQRAIAWLPDPIAEVVTQLLRGGGDGAGASVVGSLVLVWGSLRIFRGLDTAFSEIYESADPSSTVEKLRDGLVVLVALSVALLAMVASSVVLGGLAGRIPFTGLLTPLGLLVGLVVAFYPIYYVFPDVDVEIRDVFPGVLVAAVGWGALQGLFQLYLAVADPSTGSFFGGVIVVVTYLYFSALVLLLGAVVNAAIGGHSVAGVERARDGFVTERADSLTLSELLAYLADLRAVLLTDSDSRTDLVGDRPRPTGDIELVERSTTEGDGNEWEVTLRWQFSDDELVRQFASGTDGQRDEPAVTDGPRRDD